jgi:hypothetical protein
VKRSPGYDQISTHRDLDDMPSMIEQLAAQWRCAAAELRRYGGEMSARALEQAAADLDAALAEQAIGTLTLQDAARESGYSVDHLARLIREGKLPNAGRQHAPRIRRADLPKKAGALRAARPHVILDRTQIARSVVATHAEQRP